MYTVTEFEVVYIVPFFPRAPHLLIHNQANASVKETKRETTAPAFFQSSDKVTPDPSESTLCCMCYSWCHVFSCYRNSIAVFGYQSWFNALSICMKFRWNFSEILQAVLSTGDLLVYRPFVVDTNTNSSSPIRFYKVEHDFITRYPIKAQLNSSK